MTTSSPQLTKLWTIPEVADYLRICTKTVRRMIKDGEIHATRVGPQYRVADRDLRAYMVRQG